MIGVSCRSTAPAKDKVGPRMNNETNKKGECAVVREGRKPEVLLFLKKSIIKRIEGLTDVIRETHHYSSGLKKVWGGKGHNQNIDNSRILARILCRGWIKTARSQERGGDQPFERVRVPLLLLGGKLNCMSPLKRLPHFDGKKAA